MNIRDTIQRGAKHPPEKQIAADKAVLIGMCWSLILAPGLVGAVAVYFGLLWRFWCWGWALTGN